MAAMTSEDVTQKIPGRKKGISRIVSAFGYSMAGLRFAATRETAFRQELLLFVLLLPLLALLPLSLPFKAILLAANALVLITELINSALEAVVNLASPGYHELAGRAKDLASAAVLLSLLNALSLWIMALISLFP
ncbi:MAG: diacylglycerol kinase [Proteobacteria bacterium]|nr:diacylglycerol kinase [Pseudomonadota bacterium]MBU1739830.1 diacylglycerol kinase [Pseudomonadota bacterium]